MPITDQSGEKARINLEYKSKVSGGRSVRLPYRMMVLGNFSPTSKEKDQEIGDRRAWQIDKSTFNQTMAEMAPELELAVDNKIKEGGEGEKLGVKLAFKHREDFHPEKIIDQVPELKELSRVRDLIKDLRSKMVRSDDLRKAIEGALRDPEKRKLLERELTSLHARESSGPAAGGETGETTESQS